ncbi:hypothetical protein JTE90_011300 [Oedothorax gibbosus]|uniref:Histone H2A n=1 Tax=Oedothorax gibbosus TaxID=931172 RepID=A0AAV6VKH1_9ARAC|nr:hypothetical protein JTE90_011300 [Oedothorax gibbosus]
MTGTRRSRTTKSEMAGLNFPVSRVRAMLQPQRVSTNATVYLTAVLQYFTAEILEQSVNAAQSENKTRIQPHHMNAAIKKDKDFVKLRRFKNAVVPKSKHIPAEEVSGQE